MIVASEIIVLLAGAAFIATLIYLTYGKLKLKKKELQEEAEKLYVPVGMEDELDDPLKSVVNEDTNEPNSSEAEQQEEESS